MVPRRKIAQFLFAAPGLLFLPGCSWIFGGSSSTTARTIRYPVKRGDTLYSIAQRFSVSMKSLIELNDLDDPDQLHVGQILEIPYRSQGQMREAPGENPPTPQPDSVKRIRLSEARQYIGHLKWPAPGTRLVSLFGPRWLSFHEGIDLAGPIGHPIYAALQGVVVYSDDRIRGYGNMVVIQSPGLMHVYGHNNRNLVRAGDHVERGDLIAELGDTGNTTGPHLHFETRIKDKNGKNAAIDPLVFFPQVRQ